MRKHTNNPYNQWTYNLIMSDNQYKKDWRLVIPKKKTDYSEYIGYIATGAVVIFALIVSGIGLSL